MRKAAALYTVVSISGAAVLALEILGTRILGPFYGVSIFLWSALITVTLAALSVGYALGGRWADRGARADRLGAVLAAAGLWILAIPWLRSPLLGMTEPLGLRAAVLVASTVLFAPPLTLLGTVTPYVIRLRAPRLEEVGRTAGDVFAISTVASVASALATGFVLIPSMGVQRLTLAIGIVLLVTGAAALFAAAGRGTRAAGVAALLVALLASVARPDPRGSEALAYHGDSPYAELRVLDVNEARYLLVDGGVHTIQALDDGTALHRYAAAMDLAKLFFDEPGRMLLIGLGGGSVVRSFADDLWSVDAVEIDPQVVRVARDYFGLSSDRIRVHVRDGRRFLAETEDTWDVVVFDAFGSSSIPFHLVTREVFAQCAERLAPGGILMLNVEAHGWRDPIVASLAATLHATGAFRHVVALPTAEPPDKLGNVVLLATDRPSAEFREERLDRPFDMLGKGWKHWTTVQKNHAWDNRFTPEIAGAPVLTDDRNPVDLWAEEINRIARRELHAFFREAKASW